MTHLVFPYGYVFAVLNQFSVHFHREDPDEADEDDDDEDDDDKEEGERWVLLDSVLRVYKWWWNLLANLGINSEQKVPWHFSFGDLSNTVVHPDQIKKNAWWYKNMCVFTT